MNAHKASLGIGDDPVAAVPVGGDDAMLAHDIRGALQGVLGGISQIEASDLDAALREQVERVAAAAITLAGLVSTALGDAPESFGTGDQGRIDLRRFLRYLVRRWTGEAKERGLSFTVEAAEDLPYGLDADLVALARTLGNLIGNSIRYCSAGPIHLDVRSDAGGGVVFRLVDEGPGLAAATLQQLARGYRPRPAVRLAHGLGLHIVGKLAEQIGGSVAIANRTPRGLEAVLRFPAEQTILSADDDDPGVEPGRDRSLAGLHILLAEDNPTNQFVSLQMLRALEARVTVTSDGVEALERFERESFDLLMVDIEMPRMSGLDVIRRIRGRSDARATVPIVALTAHALREHRDRIAEAGADGLISKPIKSVAALGRALRPHLPGRPVVPSGPGALGSVAADRPEPQGSPIVDREVYDALCQTIGLETMSELLDKVDADLISAREGLTQALALLDLGPIRAASHILISVAGAIGAGRLQACARRLNETARAERSAGIADEVHGCIGEIDAAVAFVRDRRSVG